MLLNTCKVIGLAVNTGKTKYMELGRHRDRNTLLHIDFRLGYLILHHAEMFNKFFLIHSTEIFRKIFDPQLII